MTFKRRMMSSGNKIGLWLHRAFKGRLDAFGDQKVMMLTSPGRRSGVPRSTMVSYLDDPAGYLVWGTGSGLPNEPDWFRNLRRSPEATVEIGTTSTRVRREVLVEPERDRVWRAVVLAHSPKIEKYEQKSQRVIPIARLTPIDPTRPPAR